MVKSLLEVLGAKMALRRILWIATVLIAGCATGPKRLAELDHALTEIQSGRPEQGRGELSKLCTKGVTGACALLGQSTKAIEPLPIMQSVTSSSQSRFVIVTSKDEDLTYFVKSGSNFVRLPPEHFERPTSDQAVDHVEAFNLTVGPTYEFLVLGPDGRLWDQRNFQALDAHKKRARVAVISCMDDHLKEPMEKMWPQVLRQKPDAILLIGDNVYADHVDGKWVGTSPDVLWTRYVQTRMDLPLFKAKDLIPTLATWDDHDFGHNDADRTYPYKAQSTDIFMAFFAQHKPAPNFSRGPGVSSAWTAFGTKFLLLDDRSFRSPDKLDLPDQTHFGVDQEKWIVDHLEKTKVPIFLVDGDQFFGGYHPFESYEGSHPKSFKKQLPQWRKSASPIIFVSGDRHLSEIIKVPANALGYPTFEITSSGIHATVFADAFKKNPSPNQLVGVAGQYNYSILELMRAEPHYLEVGVQAFGLDDKQLYQKTLTVKH